MSTTSEMRPQSTLPAGRRSSERPGGVLRLTRRGRLVVTLALLAVLLGVLLATAGRSVATDEAGAAAATHTVVVERGDTLWGIAAAVAGDRDLREVVHEIERLNSLPGPELVEGQALAVPIG